MRREILNSYTEQDHAIWMALYSRSLQFLPETADAAVLDGIKKLGFPSDHIPDFEELNTKLSGFTDWQLVPMEDMVEDNEFIGMLASKKYPCRNWLRSNQQLEADIDEYDMFHDVMGHTPLLIIPAYSNYLTGMGRLALEHLNNKEIISCLKRIYWHSVQFGLTVSKNTLKIYGAHFLSSRSETIYSLSAGVPKYDLNVGIMMDTPYVRGRFQDKYFTINSYEHLESSLESIKVELDKRVK